MFLHRALLNKAMLRQPTFSHTPSQQVHLNVWPILKSNCINCLKCMLIQDTGTPSCRSCPITLSPSVLDMMLRIKLLTGKHVTRAAKLSLPFQCFERQRMDTIVTLYSMTTASILYLSLKLNAHPVHCTLQLSTCMEIFKVQQVNLFLWAEEHADLPFLI